MWCAGMEQRTHRCGCDVPRPHIAVGLASVLPTEACCVAAHHKERATVQRQLAAAAWGGAGVGRPAQGVPLEIWNDKLPQIVVKPAWGLHVPTVWCHARNVHVCIQLT